MRATVGETRRDLRLALVVAGLVAAGAFLAAAFAGQLAQIFDSVDALLKSAAAGIESGLKTAPALMSVILIACSLPCIAILSRGFARSLRSRDATRLHRRSRSRAHAAGIEPAGRGWSADAHWQAYVEVVGAPGHRYPVHGDMMRIGREDDNDIRIPHAAVHRYHAAISREDFDHWRITDLSGLDGNGLVINGARRSEALLADGDVIDLGPGRLRFRFAAI